MDTTNSDIIFAGAGLSGLYMAVEMAQNKAFAQKKILLIERDEKKQNDRTWCFWAKPDEALPPVVFQTWDKCLFFGENFESVLPLAPYRYHMVRGIDFYNWAKGELGQYENIRWAQETIESIEENTGTITTNKAKHKGDWVLNSAFTPTKLLHDFPMPNYRPGLSATTSASPASSKHTFLLQHFKGAIIETPDAAFDASLMTLMDYRIDQKGETRFVYVLPLSNRRALVEFTVFSSALCPVAEYECQLRDYIDKYLKIKQFDIIEEEFGVIPMTDFPLPPQRTGRVINIGTSGGFVKASSGYSFLRALRKSRQFVRHWAEKGLPDPSVMRSPSRFKLYDATLLQVLQTGSVSGKSAFSAMFRQCGAAQVFKFLDEDTTLGEELRVMHSVPVLPFAQAAMSKLFNGF